MVQIQPTPNPNAKKVVFPSKLVEEPLIVATTEDAEGHPLATELMAIDGVTDLYFLGNFVTVSKQAEADWEDLLSQVQQVAEGHGG